MSESETPKVTITPQPDRARVLVVWAVVGAGLAVAASFFDQRVTDWLTDELVRQRIFLIFWLPAALGFYIFMLAILAAFPNRWRLFRGFLAPVLLSAAITHLLKWAVGRARPQMNLGPANFKPFASIDDFENWALHGNWESFPSGHSSAAATLAVLLGIYFPKARWVFYFFAGMVGLERLIHDKHFLSDVLAGFVFGSLSVYLCIRWMGWKYYQTDLPSMRA